jgi:hypothetical protein
MSKKGATPQRAKPVAAPFVSAPLPVVKSISNPKDLPAPELDLRDDGPEHRHFPRARFSAPVSIWIGEGAERRFSATLRCTNISVSGMFLDSTFFLPIGTEVLVSVPLEAGQDPVLARAEVVREERVNPRTGQGRSGFGLRFAEFFGQTEVMLARLFLAQRLRNFAQSYLQSKRARSLSSELERGVDALAAWELSKATSPGDPWRGELTGEE